MVPLVQLFERVSGIGDDEAEPVVIAEQTFRSFAEHELLGQSGQSQQKLIVSAPV